MSAHELWSLLRLAVRKGRALVRLGSPTTGAAVLIRDDAGRVLLVRSRYRRGWCVPGGYGEPGETYVETVRREVHEELGLVLEHRPQLVAERENRATNHVSGLFVARLDDKHAEAVSARSWEISEVRWFSDAELRGPNPSKTRCVALVQLEKLGCLGELG